MQIIPTVVVVSKTGRTTYESRSFPAPHTPVHPVSPTFPMALFRLPPWIVPDREEWQRNLPGPDDREP